MSHWPGNEIDDCGICGKRLDDTRVFGLCHQCAEEMHAARKARKMLSQVVRDHAANSAGKRE